VKRIVVLIGVFSFALILVQSCGEAHSQDVISHWKKLVSQTRNLYQQEKYYQAEAAARKALEFAKKAFGNDSLESASSLDWLGAVYQALARYSEAEPLKERSLEIREQKLGKDHLLVASSLNKLALLYWAQASYSAAERLYGRSLKIRERKLGKDHPLVATCLNALGVVCQAQGRYSEAESLYRQSLEIRERKLGKDHLKVAISLHAMALLYCDQGRYSEAEPLRKRSLAILKKKLGKDHSRVAISLNALAELYRAQGRHSEAVPLQKRSLKLKERKLGEDHPAVANSLNNLALLYRSQGRYSEAAPLYKRCLVIYEKKLGKGHPGLTNAVNNLAEIYLDQGNLALAEPLIAKSGFQATRGRLELLKSNYRLAVNHYVDAVAFAQTSGNFQWLLTSYTGLGTAYEGLGQYEKAREYYSKGVELVEKVRSSLPKNQRETFFEVKAGGFYRTAPFEGLARVLMKLNHYPDAWRTSEHTKARVFAEALSKRMEGRVLDVPPEVLKRDNELTDRLASLNKNRQAAHARGQYDLIPVLDRQVKELEEQLKAHIGTLRKRYPIYAAAKYPEPIEIEQTALDGNEWVLSYDVTDSGVIIYLTKGKNLVKGLFKQIPRKELDGLVRKFREPVEIGPGDSIRKKLTSFDFATGKKLADILLREILTDLREGDPLTIVPDDSLGVIPFEMLVLNEGGKVKTNKKIPYVSGAEFLGDRNPISYYQSITALTLGRTFAKRKKTGTKNLVMCDPVFDAEDPRLKQMAKKRGKTMPDALAAKLMSIKNEIGLTFPRLALTRQLGESIKKLDPAHTEDYSGMEAVKPVLFEKTLDRYRTMVFATHGYFGKDLPGIQEPVLVLTLVGQSKGVDGFLRMSEVMGLKMNADIVALTACQTGLGRRISGEGTMGMGRAFQYAGARSVLMSLWSVAESSSVKLVGSFFKNLREGKNKLEALHMARKEIRSQGYDHPFFWAPFILVGEVN